MSTLPNSHACLFLSEMPPLRILKVSLRDGRTFRLRSFVQVDSSVYDRPDGWSAVIVECVAPDDAWNRRLFHPGGDLDFYESDLGRIVDEKTGDVLFSAPSGSMNPDDVV